MKIKLKGAPQFTTLESILPGETFKFPHDTTNGGVYVKLSSSQEGYSNLACLDDGRSYETVSNHTQVRRVNGTFVEEGA